MKTNYDYLLRELQVTPLCFRVKRANLDHAPGGVEDAVVSYIRIHPGATLNDVRTFVPPLGEWTYDAARAVIVRLVDANILEVSDQLPLEEADLRYERVPTCNLCDSPSSDHPIVLWKYNTPVVRCSSCGLLYANPRWKAEHLFGRYTDDYWALYADKVRHTAFNPETNLARWRPYLSDLEPARQTGRLLDVGCATGEFLAAARICDWKVYGVETSPIAAERARHISDSEIHVGTLETATYPDGWFDVVTLWDVLEHLQDPRTYVQQIARVLRPGGMFALTTPNIRSLAYRLLGREWSVVGPNDHIYYFAPRTLSRLLTGNGFAIHRMQTMGTQPDVWKQWLRYPPLQTISSELRNMTTPIVDRFLLGDELYAIGRKAPW